jgi:hypothetical protein
VNGLQNNKGAPLTRGKVRLRITGRAGVIERPTRSSGSKEICHSEIDATAAELVPAIFRALVLSSWGAQW